MGYVVDLTEKERGGSSLSLRDFHRLIVVLIKWLSRGIYEVRAMVGRLGFLSIV